MNTFPLAALLGVLLSGCAASSSTWEHVPHGMDGDCGEEDGCVTLVCAEARCGLYRCDETHALLARGTRPPTAAAAPGSNPRRNRGPVQHLPTDTQPVFTFDWLNQPSQATLPKRLPSGPGWERHHLFPQEESLARWFARKPRNTRIHDFTMVIPRDTHLRIHTPGGRGGPWNKAWRDFIEANPTATSQQVWEHLGTLIKLQEAAGMKLFRVRPDEAAHRAGNIDGRTRWALPGVECPACGAEWSNIGEVYPTVDLSRLPEAKRLEDAGSEPLEAFEQLREQVRPLAPPGAPLLPGAEFGPFTVTKASGRFADFYFPEPWWLMASPSALEKLQAAGLRGLKGAPLESGTRKLKSVPELLHLELPARGRLLPPEGQKPPCVRCGREAFTLPKTPVLEAGTPPRDADLFRLANFTTVLVAAAPFIQAVERLGLKGAVFEELPVSSR